MKSTNDGAEAEDRSSIVAVDSAWLPVARSARSLDESPWSIVESTTNASRAERIMYKILRRGSGRVFVLCIVVLSLLLCLYYVSQVQAPSSGHPAAAILNEELRYDRSLTSVTPDYSESPDAQVSLATCPVIVPRNADIDAQQEFGKFDFQVSTLCFSRKAAVPETIFKVFSLRCVSHSYLFLEIFSFLSYVVPKSRFLQYSCVTILLLKRWPRTSRSDM